ncbi:MAG: hypothetical protein Q9208_000414 [Pyrenodesmia sp. 3 TL-2023]
MDRSATLYAPWIASVRSTIALQLAPKSTQPAYSTSARLASLSRPRPLKKQHRCSVSQKVKDGQNRPQTGTQVLHFRQFADVINDSLSVTAEDLSAWIQQFLKLGSSQLLDGDDCGEVVRVLHNLDRKNRKEKDKEKTKLIHNLVANVRQAYVSGLLPSTKLVPLRLLSYYKESGHFDEGMTFWKWLSAEEAKLDPVYAGAAIEFLAVYGAGIRYCENVYERTLLQQEGIGSQYHLSPGAISGTSLGLLQGILSARLLYGKWQRSYLALDTAFMLRPTQIVPRFLDLFVYERPIFEALPVFFMYCRGGNTVSSVTLTAILNSLKSLASHISHQRSRTRLIEAMFHVVEAYVGSAGRLGVQHLNILTSAFMSATPSSTVVAPTEMVMDCFTKLFRYFSGHNTVPNSITLAEIISKATSLRHPQLAKTAFQHMLSLGLSPSKSIANHMIKVADSLRDPDILKSAWVYVREGSMSDADEARGMPDPHSWKALAAAARTCGLESFVEEELEQNRFGTLTPEILSEIRSALQPVRSDISTQRVPLSLGTKAAFNNTEDAYAFAKTCTEVSSCLTRMESLQRTGFRDFHVHPVEVPTPFQWPERGEETWQRKLYDELSTEKTSGGSHPTVINNPEEPMGAPPDISNTAIPFDELRYLNWKTINKLLTQAEIWERNVEGSTDTTIRDQMASPRQAGSQFTSGRTAIRYPITFRQLKAYQRDVENEQATHMTEAEWRGRVLRLRSPDYETQS